MPVVTIKLLEGAFSEVQQEELALDVLASFERIGGAGLRANVQVLVEEVRGGLWWSGDSRLTAELIEARRKARAAAGSPDSAAPLNTEDALT